MLINNTLVLLSVYQTVMLGGHHKFSYLLTLMALVLVFYLRILIVYIVSQQTYKQMLKYIRSVFGKQERMLTLFFP